MGDGGISTTLTLLGLPQGGGKTSIRCMGML